jgi:NTE family protein
MPQRLFALIAVSLPLLAAMPAHSSMPDPSATAERPRVGLVLSGGGARGGAHIGVLRVLEELRVPVDYVTGTSIGSIVGGLYAAGLGPDEIEAAVATMDWDALFQDRRDRKHRSFRRKQDDRQLLVKVQPGFDIATKEVKLPAGLIQGQRIKQALRELTVEAADVEDFDQLSIPFRAVATDLSTGRPIELATGNLADAMWASMAVPGVFAPARLDGRLLVDGGVSNNLPIDVARGMGADVLIVVDISTPLKSAEDLTDVFAVTDQLTSIMTRANTERQLATLAPDDVQIVPLIEDVTTADFRRLAEVVTTGYAAADAQREALARLSVTTETYDRWLASRQARPELPVIEFIEIVNDAGLGEEVLMVNVRHPLGQRLDMPQLERDIAMIYGTELFETVTSQIVQRDDRAGIVIDARAKSWGPDYLQFGMDLEDDFEGDTLYNLRVAYLLTVRNLRGAEWRTVLTVGQDPGIETEWYQPIDRIRRYFVSPAIRLRKFNLTEYDGDDRVAEYRFSEAAGRLAFGRIFGNWGELRLGYEAATGDTSLRVGDPELATPDYDLGRLYAGFTADTLDNSYFPTDGAFVQAVYSWHRPSFGDDESFDRVFIKAGTALSWGRYTVAPGVELGTNTRGDTPFYALFRAGGFLRLSGFESNELSGQELALGRVLFYRRMNDITFLPVYLGGSAEYGAIGNDIGAGDGRAAGSLFLGVDSIFGPLYLGAGLAEGGNASGYMFLGQRF